MRSKKLLRLEKPVPRITFDPATISLMERIINCFESGYPDSTYTRCIVRNIGNIQSPQIIYGRVNITEKGELRRLVTDYVLREGRYASDIFPYMKVIGFVELYRDDIFKDLLRKAGNDPLMRELQDNFVFTRYVSATRWCYVRKLRLPLTVLVVFESFVAHSRMSKTILRQVTKPLPKNGGFEKEWLHNYLVKRRSWLGRSRNPRHSREQYRMDCFFEQIERDNWYLEQIPVTVKAVDVYPSSSVLVDLFE